jgi:hypothetical protein
MTEVTLKQKYVKIDNRLTYIVGYRNLYNFAVLMVACMSVWFGDSLGSPYYYLLAMILFVLGFKWVLVQVRENIDASDVTDTLAEVKG